MWLRQFQQKQIVVAQITIAANYFFLNFFLQQLNLYTKFKIREGTGGKN